MAAGGSDDIRVKFTPEGEKAVLDAIKDIAAQSRIAIGVATAAAAALTKAAIDNADAMYKQSQSAGLSTQAFSEYAYVAKLSDISTEQFSTSLSKFNRNIFETYNGTGESKKAFDALNISVKNTDGSLKTADQILEQVADQFSQMEDGAGKTALAVMMFGRAGAAMIPMLNEGSGKMRELREEAKQLGITIDTETGRAAEKFNDNLTRLGQVQRALGNAIMLETLPALNEFTDSMVKLAKEGELLKTFGKGVKVVFETIAVLGANVAFVFDGIGTALGAMMAKAEKMSEFDFAGAFAVDAAFQEDMKKKRAELDAFERRIMSTSGATKELADNWDLLGNMWKRPPPKLVDEEEQKRIREQMQKRLETLQQTLGTELQNENTAHAKRLAELDEFLKKRLITETAYREMRERAEQLHAEKIEQIEDKAMKGNARLEALRKSLRSEFEVEKETYNKRIEELDRFLAKGDIKREEYARLRERAEQQHADRLATMRERLQQGLQGPSDMERANHQKRLQELARALDQETATEISAHQRRNAELEGLLARKEISQEEFARRTEENALAHNERLKVIQDGIAATEVANHERRIADLSKLLERKQITEETFIQRKEAAEKQHAERMAKIQEESLISLQKYNELVALETARHEEAMRGIREQQDAQWMRVQERRIADLESIKNYLKSEEELELEAHQRRLEALVAGAEETNMTEEEYRRLREELEARHRENLARIQERVGKDATKFTKMNAMQQTQHVLGELVNLTSGIAQHSRTAFNINKAAGIANALVNAYVGVSKTLAEYPFPWNLALAAAHAAAAFAQVNAIKSQQFQGGGAGSAPALAGSVPAQPVSPVGGAMGNNGGGGGGGGGGPSRTLVVQGLGSRDLFSGDMVRQLAEELIDYQRGGGRIVFAK